ncbi:DNA-processing protein DprA [Anaerobacillus sp. HL2]|nr:DNA-processing protein DprA [Anaerobacillus sp. HL2]
MPVPKYFVERNAHISAWSTDVIVIQASEKSGSLTTAQFALDDGRNLFAVPHSIFLREAKGSNKLLEQRAKPYISPQSLGIELVETRANTNSLTQTHPSTQIEAQILAHLKESPTMPSRRPIPITHHPTNRPAPNPHAHGNEQPHYPKRYHRNWCLIF